MFGIGYNIKTVEVVIGNITEKRRMGIVDDYDQLTRFLKGYKNYRHWCTWMTVPDDVIADYLKWRDLKDQEWKEYNAKDDAFIKNKNQKLLLTVAKAAGNALHLNKIGLARNAYTAISTLREHGPAKPNMSGLYGLMKERYLFYELKISYNGFTGKRSVLGLGVSDGSHSRELIKKHLRF
ncbi:hypothetical protein ACS5NO_32190 [Larkinella sp. GY13]|uniref:hypothetical protein n=1 Tax=Larkinella sp. GY13 TaxID=3453720 RepID=UPI003EEBA392